MFKNTKILILVATILVGLFIFSHPTLIAHAIVAPAPGGGGSATTSSTSNSCPSSTVGANQPITCTTDCAATTSGCSSTSCDEHQCDLVTEYVNPFIDFLSAGVGVVVTIMIVIGGIQYTTSQDNPQAVSAAKSRIFNALIALLGFALMWSLLQWLVPGGIFHD